MYRSYSKWNQSEYYNQTHPEDTSFNASYYQFSGVYIFLPDMNTWESFDYTLLKDAYLFNESCMMFNYQVPRDQMAELDHKYSEIYNGTRIWPNRENVTFNQTNYEDLNLRNVSVIVEVFKDNTLKFQVHTDSLPETESQLDGIETVLEVEAKGIKSGG